jgi:hypothetical protein
MFSLASLCLSNAISAAVAFLPFILILPLGVKGVS